MKKFECGQKNLSVLSTNVGVECGVWSVECDSAVSGEPPPLDIRHQLQVRVNRVQIVKNNNLIYLGFYHLQLFYPIEYPSR